MKEEHKQHMRESALRRFAVMDAEKLAAFKEKCAANGRKSWAMRSAADKAERRDRSERSKRMMAEMPVEEKRRMIERLHLSCLAPVVAIPARRKGRPIPACNQPLSFPSMTAAAEWVKSRGIGGKISTIRHSICMVCCGNRLKTAYGHIWRRADDAPQSPVHNP